MFVLSDKLEFPDPSQSLESGLLAVGGDLSIERLLLAYRSGIFPWFNDDEDLILWWSPDPRFVLFPSQLKVSKSMKQLMRKEHFKITINTAFNDVITECAKAKRRGQKGTWITQQMISSYSKLHQLGYATSVEVWENNALVGGFYGVDMGNGVFCGESMFTKVSNVSKVAFISFMRQTDFKLIDCQVYTEHLESLGAKEIRRDLFLEYLNLKDIG